MAKYEELRDVQAEAGIIATLINQPEFIHFSESVDYSYFTDKANAVFYESIKNLVSSGIDKIDSFNILATINANKKLKTMAGDVFTVNFVDDVIKNSKYIARESSAEYTALVNTISSYAYRRKLYRDLEEAQKECLNGGDITVLQRSVFDKIEKTTNRFITGDSIPTIGSQVDELWEQIVSRQGTDGYAGFKTKLPTLNNYLTYERGELIVFAGGYKSGKSMFLLNTAAELLLKNIPIVYFDTEMGTRQFLERFICLLSQVRMGDLKAGRYTAEEKERIEIAKNLIKTMPLYHKYIPVYTIDQVYGTIKKMKSQGLIDFVIFDYIKNRDGKDTGGVYFELGEMTNFLKNDIAGDLDIPVVAGAQLNRMGDVADSIKIQQYSSAVVKIKRKTIDEIEMTGREHGNYKFTVTSNRLGEQQIENEQWIDVNFYGDYCLFEEAEQHEDGCRMG